MRLASNLLGVWLRQWRIIALGVGPIVRDCLRSCLSACSRQNNQFTRDDDLWTLWSCILVLLAIDYLTTTLFYYSCIQRASSEGELPSSAITYQKPHCLELSHNYYEYLYNQLIPLFCKETSLQADHDVQAVPK